MKAASWARAVARAAASCALLAFASCATPSERISTALVGYGMNLDQSRCVGDDLQGSLSIPQLRKLGRVARDYTQSSRDPAHVSVRDLIRVSGQFNDPRVPIEVGRAAAKCGVLADALLPVSQ